MLTTAFSKVVGEEGIERLGLAGGVRVVCVNSHESVTISGDAPSIDNLLEYCQEKGMFREEGCH